MGGFRSKVKILPSYYRLRGYVVCFRDTREKTHVSFYLIIFIPFRAVFSLLKILITILNILMKHCNGGKKNDIKSDETAQRIKENNVQ